MEAGNTAKHLTVDGTAPRAKNDLAQGHLACSVGGAGDYSSQGHEFEPHI